MSDPTAGNNPLGDRLRATFDAERADIERRRLSTPTTRDRSRSWLWIPIAAAITAVAIAVTVFLGSEDQDQAGTTPLPLPEPTFATSPATGDDSLTEQPCTRLPAPVRAGSFDPDDAVRSSEAGDSRSDADHIHNLRAQTNQDCTRLVVEFGTNANESDELAAVLPPVLVHQEAEAIRITVTDRPLESAFGDPDRVDYEGGIGLLTLSLGYEFSVRFMHRQREPHVRFMQDPARVVIDLFAPETSDPVSPEPFGQNFVLRQPIQPDLTGQGIPVDNTIVVDGFGRPFEAQGLYRIWSVPTDVDPDIFLADPPAPLVEDLLRTSAWAEAWGSFSVELPALEPGTYIAVFGESPPTDEIGFYGTGQLFRVAGASTDDSGPHPEAQLLPDVRLRPESFD